MRQTLSTRRPKRVAGFLIKEASLMDERLNCGDAIAAALSSQPAPPFSEAQLQWLQEQLQLMQQQVLEKTLEAIRKTQARGRR